MPYVFETMNEFHRNAVIDIYNHFIATSMAAYTDAAVPYEMFDRFMDMTRGYPAVVVKDDAQRAVGFGFLRPYHPAPTFRRAAEITYFILPEHTGQGLGTAILKRFIKEGKRMGIDTILANISSHNGQSLAFHRKHGFRECGRFKRVGKKFGRDFDVVWMQLDLG
jgi:phosphinothricin acetyltransferase